MHAQFLSEDAITLKSRTRSSRAGVNRVNARREFSFATPAEVRDRLAAKVRRLFECHEEPRTGVLPVAWTLARPRSLDCAGIDRTSARGRHQGSPIRHGGTAPLAFCWPQADSSLALWR